MSVSVPEKTLEHWVSQYIAYRYRTHADLWWPTFGADVQIANLPLGPGKAFWLELKTATPTTVANEHVVEIDTAQLKKYLAKQNAGLAPPTYYAFVTPAWDGALGSPASRAWLGGAREPELAYSRSQAHWFAKWTYVVPAQKILDAAGPGPHPATLRLGRSQDGRWHFNSNLDASKIAPHRWDLRSFFTKMSACGSSDMPSAFTLPLELVPPGNGAIGRADIADLLRAYSREVSPSIWADRDDKAIAVYLPDLSTQNSEYLRVDLDELAPSEADGERPDGAMNQSRGLVMLNASKVAIR